MQLLETKCFNILTEKVYHMMVEGTGNNVSSIHEDPRHEYGQAFMSHGTQHGRTNMRDKAYNGLQDTISYVLSNPGYNQDIHLLILLGRVEERLQMLFKEVDMLERQRDFENICDYTGLHWVDVKRKHADAGCYGSASL